LGQNGTNCYLTTRRHGIPYIGHNTTYTVTLPPSLKGKIDYIISYTYGELAYNMHRKNLKTMQIPRKAIYSTIQHHNNTCKQKIE
jgi:hypothetical protein